MYASVSILEDNIQPFTFTISLTPYYSAVFVIQHCIVIANIIVKYSRSPDDIAISSTLSIASTSIILVRLCKYVLSRDYRGHVGTYISRD